MFNDTGAEGPAGFFNTPDKTFSSPGPEKPREKRAQNIVPVTARQINTSSGVLKIGDEEAVLVSLVGIVKSVVITSAKMTYMVQDDTGIAKCVSWVEKQDNEDVLPPVLENSYCRVSGALRVLQGESYIMIFNIRPLDTLNELTMHILEVIYCGLNAHRILSAENNAQPSDYNNGLNNSLMTNTSYANIDSFGSATGLTKEQQAVYQVIRESTSESGIHLDAINGALKSKLSPKQIRDVVEFLSNEGHIYSTIDDFSFKATD